LQISPDGALFVGTREASMHHDGKIAVVQSDSSTELFRGVVAHWLTGHRR